MMNQRLMDNSVPNTVSAEPNRRTPDVTFLSETSLAKRKHSDKDLPSTSVKRPNSDGSHVSSCLLSRVG